MGFMNVFRFIIQQKAREINRKSQKRGKMGGFSAAHILSAR
jgi:hypothetical protein